MVAGQGAQPRRVEIGQVDEVRADDRRHAGQVQVIGDQHGLPRVHALPQTTGGVGQHDQLGAGRRCRSDAVRTSVATPLPSYRWVRPRNTRARLSPIGTDRIEPP